MHAIIHIAAEDADYKETAQNAIGPWPALAISRGRQLHSRRRIHSPIPGFSGFGYSRSPSVFLEGGNGIWMPEGQTRTQQQQQRQQRRVHIDLIGSRERAYINKIYLGKNTGILYRVEIEAGTPRR